MIFVKCVLRKKFILCLLYTIDLIKMAQLDDKDISVSYPLFQYVDEINESPINFYDSNTTLFGINTDDSIESKKKKIKKIITFIPSR